RHRLTISGWLPRAAARPIPGVGSLATQGAAMTDTGSMTGKTVLITGGTGGIGKAAAIALSGMGARVGITGHDRARAVDAAAAITRETGNPAVDIFVADMSSQAEVRRLAIGALAIYP